MKAITLYRLFTILFIAIFSPPAKATRDPFSVLGIPNLNPSLIFREEISLSPQTTQVTSTIKSIQDIPNFLQNNNLSKEEGIKIISKFLLADDFMLKKFGAVFDQSNFDGVMSMESISPVGSPERPIQRARSAAKIFSSLYMKDREYEAYGGELQRTVPVQGWQVYKILLISRKAVSDHIFLRVCLPIDDFLVPLVTEFKSDCLDKVKNN